MVYTNKFKIKSLFKNMISLKQRGTNLFFTDIDKIKKKAETTKEKETVLEYNALTKAKEALEKDIPLRLVDFTKEELLAIKGFNFLTLKPHIYLANISENEIKLENDYVKKLKEYAKGENSKVIVVSAKIESELAELEDSDKEEMLNELGIEKSGLDKLIEEKTGIPVMIAQDAVSCVAIGTGKSLEHIEMLNSGNATKIRNF